QKSLAQKNFHCNHGPFPGRENGPLFLLFSGDSPGKEQKCIWRNWPRICVNTAMDGSTVCKALSWNGHCAKKEVPCENRSTDFGKRAVPSPVTETDITTPPPPLRCTKPFGSSGSWPE